MKRIIEGKRYDTETATCVATLRSPTASVRDFRYEDTSLYRTPRGAWFVAGKGGPMSQWRRQVDLNGWTSGEGLRPVDEEEAREILENEDELAAIEKYFSKSVVDA
jgi:hypothetical protein